MAEQEWPGASQDFVNAVSEAIGFKADTHEEVFPHVEIIWLDQGRHVPEAVIANYARDRMAVYKSYWPKDISIPSTEGPRRYEPSVLEKNWGFSLREV